jgi:hypothetical protein
MFSGLSRPTIWTRSVVGAIRFVFAPQRFELPVQVGFRPLHRRARATLRSDENFADLQALLAFGDNEVWMLAVVFENRRLAEKPGRLLGEEALAPFLRGPCHRQKT